MQAHWPARAVAPAALGALGAAFAILAAVDKVVGLVQRPLHLATAAYVFLFCLLLWAATRGLPWRPGNRTRLSFYTAFLSLNLLTAIYVLAWRVSADPTPLLLQARLRQGDELLASGRRDEANLIYREAYGRNSRSFPVLMRLGAVNYQLGDYDRAQRYYTRAVEQAPTDERWHALNDLGQTYWKMGEPQEAVDLYLRAGAAGLPESERVEWHYRLGWAYFDLKDYDAAVEHYTIVGEAGQRHAAASFYNAACARAQKLRYAREPEAREQLARAAVNDLRRAWKAITSEEEGESLRQGLLGSEEERDPELAPLRGTAALAQFLREIQTG